MRILRPPNYIRGSIVSGLESFFDHEHEPVFKRAIGKLCKFYHLPYPTIVWYERLGRRGAGTLAGKCEQNGTICLIHPENWKRCRKYNSRKQWVGVVLHELGHFALWADHRRLDSEDKADRFRDAILRGHE